MTAVYPLQRVSVFLVLFCKISNGPCHGSRYISSPATMILRNVSPLPRSYLSSREYSLRRILKRAPVPISSVTRGKQCSYFYFPFSTQVPFPILMRKTPLVSFTPNPNSFKKPRVACSVQYRWTPLLSLSHTYLPKKVLAAKVNARLLAMPFTLTHTGLTFSPMLHLVIYTNVKKSPNACTIPDLLCPIRLTKQIPKRLRFL